jgi:hypothetical protein
MIGGEIARIALASKPATLQPVIRCASLGQFHELEAIP